MLAIESFCLPKASETGPAARRHQRTLRRRSKEGPTSLSSTRGSSEATSLDKEDPTNPADTRNAAAMPAIAREFRTRRGCCRTCELLLSKGLLQSVPVFGQQKQTNAKATRAALRKTRSWCASPAIAPAPKYGHTNDQRRGEAACTTLIAVPAAVVREEVRYVSDSSTSRRCRKQAR